MEVKDLIKELETKCASSKGYMGVYLDEIKSPNDIFENVKDEIMQISSILETSYIEREVGIEMTEREAKGYLKKLNNFLKRHGQEA